MSETITGNEIEIGDVIKSAAMSEPQTVTSVWISSTGRTVEVSFVRGPNRRIGLTSKVRRYDVRREARCICADMGATGPNQRHTRCTAHNEEAI